MLTPPRSYGPEKLSRCFRPRSYQNVAIYNVRAPAQVSVRLAVYSGAAPAQARPQSCQVIRPQCILFGIDAGIIMTSRCSLGSFLETFRSILGYLLRSFFKEGLQARSVTLFGSILKSCWSSLGSLLDQLHFFAPIFKLFLNNSCFFRAVVIYTSRGTRTRTDSFPQYLQT